MNEINQKHQQLGETMFHLALDLLEDMPPDQVKERLAMLMLYHHACASGESFSSKTMAQYLDPETLILNLKLAELFLSAFKQTA